MRMIELPVEMTDFLYKVNLSQQKSLITESEYDEFLRYMEQLTGKNMLNIQIGPLFEAETMFPDNDLEKSMNLIWNIKPNTNIYANSAVIPDSTAQQLSLLTVGDSFFWNFGYTVPMDQLFKTYHHWYYFNLVFYDPDHTSVSQIDLLDEFGNTDVVMLCFSASKLYVINGGFLSRALIELTLDTPGAIDNILNDIKRDMETNEAWYESLKQKANAQGKSLEQVIQEDAIYLINQYPERYLD